MEAVEEMGVYTLVDKMQLYKVDKMKSAVERLPFIVVMFMEVFNN